MANFIGLVYATLKNEGIDTKDMSTDEAVKKYNELQKKAGGKAGEKGYSVYPPAPLWQDLEYADAAKLF